LERIGSVVYATLIEPSIPESVQDVAFDQEVFEGSGLGRSDRADRCGPDCV